MIRLSRKLKLSWRVEAKGWRRDRQPFHPAGGSLNLAKIAFMINRKLETIHFLPFT